MPSNTELAALKVPELKARCKQLNIAGIAKLKKAELIACLLAARPGSETPPGPDQRRASEPAVDHTHPSDRPRPPDQRPVTLEERVVEVAEKKRKKVSAVKESNKKAKTDNSRSDAGEGSASVEPASQALDSRRSHQLKASQTERSDEQTPAASVRTSTFTALPPQLAEIASRYSPALPPLVKPVNQAKKVVKTANQVKKSVITTIHVHKADKVNGESSASVQASLPTSTGPPPKPNVSKNLLKRSAVPLKVTTFKPLVSVPRKLTMPVKNVVTHLHPLAILPSTRLYDYTTPHIAYLRSHFLNRLFTVIHASRCPPLTAPYPSPVFSSAVAPSIPADLAFQGFHADVFAAPTIAFEVAIRFVIARLHTMLSLGAGEEWGVQAGAHGLLGPDLTRWPVVVECRRIVDDVYLVVTQVGEEGSEAEQTQWSKKVIKAGANNTPPDSPKATGVTERFLVLSATGEVVARSRRPHTPSGASQPTEIEYERCLVRPDWHAYLTARLDQTTSHKPLHAHVRTKDDTWCPGGIAKVWTERASQEALDVARRVVYSSCVLNSYSGEKLGAVQMDAEWLGRAGEYGRLPSTHVELYLPESHQVTSLALGAPLHPGLAAVQRVDGTPRFVLAETGQVVGGDQVSALWCGILGCDEGAREDDGRAAEFWRGWEASVVGRGDG